ncbi:MAG TPA: hypothetical protein VGT79_06090, partial [Xanthomonadaceae bacterium]|nr:hypothetical protein [Xanthomonadaceae bacterium]
LQQVGQSLDGVDRYDLVPFGSEVLPEFERERIAVAEMIDMAPAAALATAGLADSVRAAMALGIGMRIGGCIEPSESSQLGEPKQTAEKSKAYAILDGGYTLLAHMHQGTVQVKAGDQINDAPTFQYTPRSCADTTFPV